jgi:hypothetical protein
LINYESSFFAAFNYAYFQQGKFTEPLVVARVEDLDAVFPDKTMLTIENVLALYSESPIHFLPRLMA